MNPLIATKTCFISIKPILQTQGFASGGQLSIDNM